MRLIDADVLEEQIQQAIKNHDEVAEGFKLEEFSKLARGIMSNMLALVQKQPTVKRDIEFPKDFYLDEVGVWRLKKDKLKNLL